MTNPYLIVKIFEILLFSSYFAISGCSTNTVLQEEPLPDTEGSVKVAKWKDDKKAALTFMLDDSTPGQATLGLPAMNKRNLIGTWFVNPGTDYFADYRNYWEKIAPEGGQELADHTMNHIGASNPAEVLYEVGEAAKVIWKIRGEEIYSSLIAFQKGGSTEWDEASLNQVIKQFNLIDRDNNNLGESHYGASIQDGENTQQMSKRITEIINSTRWGLLTFHGIAKNAGSPPMDDGWAGVWINDFETFLDNVVAHTSELWVGGYIQVYKYIKERQTAKVSINQFSDSKFKVYLTSEMDEKYYNEPLTLIVNLPSGWTNCVVSQNDYKQSFNVKNGVLMCNGLPNKGDIIIEKQ